MIAAPAARPATVRTRRVVPCMGTVFSLDVRDPGGWDDALDEVVALLHRVDRVFSTYRDGSDVSRLRRGELAIADADPLVGEVLALCGELQRETAGWFSARFRGGIDPTGAVKGWAVEEASRLLRHRGSTAHALNGGGDVQTAGGPAAGAPWRVGVADPHAPGRVAAVVAVRGLAVATSGTAERGAHVLDPFTQRPATGLASVTVVGPSLTRADAYATACVARGEVRWLEELPGYDALAIAADGTRTSTRGFARHLAA